MEGLFLYLSVKTKYMKKSKILETDRLLIRPTNVDDAAFILELLNTPKWISFIGDRNLQTVEDAQNYIKDRMLPQLEKLGFSNNSVILKDGNKKIGVCGLYCRGNSLDELELGFALLPEFEQKGLGNESTARLIEFGFTNLPTQRIKAITNFYNLDSQKLLQKLGFSFVRDEIEDNGEEVKVYLLNKNS